MCIRDRDRRAELGAGPRRRGAVAAVGQQDDHSQQAERDDHPLPGPPAPPPRSGSQLGTPVRDGNLEFVVASVRCGVPQVGSGLVKRTAGGQYCLANVRATNVKDDARTLYEPFQKLVDSAGHKHSADLTMRVVFRDQTIWDKIEPGQQVRGTMVFDIPKNVSATALELHDGIASGGVTVPIR